MDVTDTKALHAEVKKRMDGQIDHVRRELAGVRTGRASINLLDSVHVDAYGAPGAPQPGRLAVHPRTDADRRAAVRPVAHGRRREGGAGGEPRVESRQRRQGRAHSAPGPHRRAPQGALALVHKLAEEGRNGVRQVRREANDRLKKFLKDHAISEDDERRALDEVQKTTDQFIHTLDDMQKKKDAELLHR